MPAPVLTAGSLQTLMERLVAAEAGINDVIPAEVDSLDISMWKPASPDPPVLYHAISNAPFSARDTATWRDNLMLLARIGVPHGDDQDTMTDLTILTDAFRLVMDPILGARGRPLDGAAQWAERTDMRTVLDDFNEVPFMCMEFVLQFRLDRLIEPT